MKPLKCAVEPDSCPIHCAIAARGDWLQHSGKVLDLAGLFTMTWPINSFADRNASEKGADSVSEGGTKLVLLN